MSARTMLGVERGSATVSLGNALNIAVLAGVDLFGIDDPVEFARARRRGEEKLTFIPSKVYRASDGLPGDGDYDF
ncbi:hypothetical protein BH09ACT6_BH09ACT6_01730 [soil metagenome]